MRPAPPNVRLICATSPPHYRALHHPRCTVLSRPHRHRPRRCSDSCLVLLRSAASSHARARAHHRAPSSPIPPRFLTPPARLLVPPKLSIALSLFPHLAALLSAHLLVAARRPARPLLRAPDPPARAPAVAPLVFARHPIQRRIQVRLRRYESPQMTPLEATKPFDDANHVRNLDHVPSHLPETDLLHPVPYTVSVSTANDKWACTNCDVFIQIIGDFHSTDFIHLKEDEHNVKSTLRYVTPTDANADNAPIMYFPIGSIREFHFNAQFVGNLRTIRIRHRSMSRSKAWKPDRFVVHNEDLQRSWSFLCGRWLNFDNGNHVELQPTGDVSAGRRASRRASRRLSAGKQDRPSPVADTHAEHFASMRNRFGGNLSQTANAAMANSVEAGTRRVCFQLQKFTQRACHVYLLGGIPALGEWQPERAIRMEMHSAADGTWRGEWRLELEIDDDFEVVQYTYMIITDSHNPSERQRVECPDEVRNLNLSCPEVLERIAEGGRIYVSDVFGNSKFTSPSQKTPSSVFRRRMSQRQSIQTPMGAGRLVAGQLPINRSPAADADVQRNLNTALDETAVSQRAVMSPSFMQEEISRIEDTVSRDTNPPSETSNIEASSASESREFESDSRTAWQDQLQQADGQLFQSAKRILRRESEVMSLRQRNSLEISTSPNLLSSGHTEPEKTSPVSSDSAVEDDQDESFGASADEESFAGSVAEDSSPMNRIDLANLTKPFVEERDRLKEEVDKLNHHLEEKCRTNALECNDFKTELIEIRQSMVEQCEVHEAQQAELVRLVMDNRDASNNRIAKLEELSQAYLHRWRREFKERRKLFNTVQELRGNIRVFCRVRPLKGATNSDGTNSEIAVEFPDAATGENAAIRCCSKQFEFDRVFSPKSSQREVYDETSGVVASVFDGYNVCVFAYGQTGSGKTHTMNGPEHDRGVNYRALVDLFDIASERSEHSKVSIFVSMMEIYNENLHDLVRTGDPAKAPKLEVRKDPDSNSPNGVYVPNLTEVEVDSVDSVWDVMERGSRNRRNGKTNMNEYSSRSHLILKIKVANEDIESGVKKAGVLYLVDLAGSERVSRSNVSGERLKEAQHINKSLATLGDVFMSLLSKSPHVPYRNSRLTYLLQDSLGGNSKTLMFVNVSADETDSAETLSSLQFAQRVAKVELGSAKRQTERNGDSRSSAALQSKEAELQAIQTKFSNLQRELKKRDAEKEDDHARIRTLESELRAAKRTLEEKQRRDSLGRDASVRESKAAEEKRQAEIRAANQRTKEVGASKDNEIKKLQAMLQAREKKISELSRNAGKSVENESGASSTPGRTNRPTSAPGVLGRKPERTPLRSRQSSTFAGRTRQVRFDESHLTDESSGKSSGTDSSKPTMTPRRPLEGRTPLPRSQTVHSRPQRQTPASNPSAPGKRVVYAFGSRVEVDDSDSSVGAKQVRPANRLQRPATSTSLRPPRRAGQPAENRNGQQASSSAPAPGGGALRRAGTVPGASRVGMS